jgi:DNA-binding MarR family transcriptional regulator
VSGLDEVDRIAAAWQREQPDLDLAALQVLSRVTRLARHLDRARRAAFAEHGLEPSEFDVLAALRRAGPPYEQSPGQLASTTMVTSGTMTARVKKLEGRGLVRRRTDPQDGRAVIVTLTDEGRATVSGALASLLEREQALLSPLTSREQASLAQLLRPLLQPLDSPSG